MPEPDEDRQRHETHDAVTEQLRAHGLVDEDAIVAGWVLAYETVGASGTKTSGYIQGPHDMSSWRAVGLLEWVKNFMLNDTDD